ncbi:hypothetical protein H1P_300046 [Hyella patelloides LEGE 07179]|uniref:DUF5648 domain-containing protein n=1 Tax=Hyella patelloides LEGE 07179 TaxID=945734 RepID=A0A563VUF5_9CYAN|nr:hypothetical protein [Hyella patelloides]VEP15024.1 hypothetical protein H1P_300046 [Hyella patelloides LEGE 07179]
MSRTDNQEVVAGLEQPVVEELIPTDLVEVEEDRTSSSIPNESLALLSPDNLGTVLSVGNAAINPGTTVTIPILISDAESLQSLSVDLTYNTSILSIADPNPDTPENEGVRRAGISADWALEPSNPVANVNEETGEVGISLVNTGDLPQPDEDGNVPSGTILEIDFQVSEDADLDSLDDELIDLQSARVGVNDEDIAVGDDNLSDGPVLGPLDTNINRFQSTERPGTFLFAGEAESVSIRENFSDTFVEEGLAFQVADEPGEDLIQINRFQNTQVPGTFLFAAETESVNIRDNFSDTFVEEGIAFYVFGAGSDQATPFTRFQNIEEPGTFVFASPQESASIRDNFSDTFIEEGIAFEAGT